MIGSAVLYAGFVLALVGLVSIRKPVGVPVLLLGVSLLVVGLFLPARESRATEPRTRLDKLVPAWQFREHHVTTIAAPPTRVFAAIKEVRADEILLFRTLTWIRRGGRELPESILRPGENRPILDVATRTGFARLADDEPRELVIGTIVVRPPGARLEPTLEVFRHPPSGSAVAAMNFLVEPEGAGRSRVSTETRVFAAGDGARRRFAM